MPVSATPDASAARSVGFHHNWTPEQQAYDGAFEGLSFVFYGQTAGDDASIADLAAETTVGYYDRTYGGDEWNGHVDHRAGWHRNTISFETWVRAHAYREARDWREKRLAEWFEQNRHHAREFGFGGDGDGLDAFQADPPSQSRLWEVWNEEFSEVVREACRELAKQFFLTAVENSLPLPAGPFEPENRDIGSERGEQQFIGDKTKEVWQQTKPFVTDSFYLKRANNWCTHENAFWEQHAYMGMRQEMYAQSGQYSFAIDTDRERTPSASNHRHQIQKLSVEETREMLQNTTRALIARARHNDELDRQVTVAIDITKSKPFTGDRDGYEDVILGYKNDRYDEVMHYYQWATIQVVGLDVPLILDSVPIRKGESPRHEVVDELLSSATDMLPNIHLVMMDREFDARKVKNVCDSHGVHYLCPTIKRASEKATCTRLRRSGQRVYVKTQQTVTDAPDRHQMFLPAQNRELFPAVEADDEDIEQDESDEPEETVRQELVNEFNEAFGEDVEGDSGHGFEEIVEKMEEDEEFVGSDEDAAAYAVFETNLPEAEDLTETDDEDKRLNRVRSIVSRYSNRWGVENTYKRMKKFQVRTTSKDPEYRFFNFAFACVLYNVWRLVDLLVKLAIEDDPDYAPRVDANQFLTVSKQFYGLDPPD